MFTDLSPAEQSFAFRGKSYIVREAPESAVKAFKACQLKATRFGADGSPVGVDGSLADAQSILIQNCLYEVYEDAGTKKERPVVIAQVLAMPHRLTKQLFDWIKEVSDLSEKPKEGEQIKRALSLPDSPITFEAFRDYILALPEFKALQLLVRAVEDNEPKKGQHPSANVSG